MIVPTDPPRLFVSHDKDFHWLIALEYGRVGEDQPQGCWHMVSEDCAYLLDAPEGRVVGFRINDFHTFDPDDPEVEAIWEGPRFDAPILGLTNATAGEIAIAARHHFGDRDSLNRAIFGVATSHEGEEALTHWTHCLESGDAMAHFALGYTLFELGRPTEAYGHLRHYTEIAPMGAWNWHWYGQAAESLGEITEARRAYRRAIELDEPDEDGDSETDADERLVALERRVAEEAAKAAAEAAAVVAATQTAERAGESDDEPRASSAHAPSITPSTSGTDDEDDLADPADHERMIAFDGEDLPHLGRRQLEAFDRDLAAGITAGARKKSYAATDPNEDAVRVFRTNGATVILVADGHNGESSARVACDVIASLLEEDQHAVDTEADLVELLTGTNGAVRSATAALGQPESRTTLVLAVVRGSRVRWASMGDSLVLLAEPDGTMQRLGTPRHRFLGWPMDAHDVLAAVDHGEETLPADGWLVLASDGLTDFVDDPAEAVRAATRLELLAHVDAEDLREALCPTAIRVVDELIDAACDGGAGDNVAVVALRGTGPTDKHSSCDTADEHLSRTTAEDEPAAGPDALNRFRGCLLGGAVGDALGAGIEHDSLSRIRHRFGPDGLQGPAPAYGRESAITDDTQMTLFTAEALLRTYTREAERGIPDDPVLQLDEAYARWLRTQGEQSRRWKDQSAVPSTVERLLTGPDARRGPGRTCIAAMRGSVAGSPEEPTNSSKGCGGVVRVAPIGLVYGDPEAAADVARRAAALTHGHPTGFHTAGAFAMLIAQLRAGEWLGIALQTVIGSLTTSDAQETREALVRANTSARLCHDPLAEDVEFLGEGWVADEALAIAVNCALVAESFEHGLLLAVNHGGASPSTGAICGALLGTIFGLSAIPDRWLAGLEHGDEITEIADDLHAVSAGDGGVDVFGERWQGRWPAE
ncbi:ADP-ribosylglycohydrolase family protein [Patulibacter sp.]|uniref:ADP-ribosylglycohydrolase family protein n=1 Tax=Patulibacter sp. TaxID=1912859 RepID=UPI00271E2E38|nr:ADP-ribosylglycohydrolase family protein [Patulibacter sp.]MDO9410072.1 ADP-ribosylglycohydrolase family protein [Patulibacter sp.]